MIGRRGPFGHISYEPKKIVEMVKNYPPLTFGNDVALVEPFRPDLECLMDSNNYADYIGSCIKEAWDENPELRPDFPTIR